ncbi:uncharacterized protein LOC144168516 [Haemaphysalis longicornis]
MLAVVTKTCLCCLVLLPLLGAAAEEKYRFFRKSVKGKQDELDESCAQPCQNRGKCYKERCLCTPGFRGKFCEYPISLCDLERAGFHGQSQCNHSRLASTCVLECSRGLRYEYLPPTNVYTCSADGQWAPPDLPRCIDEAQEKLKKNGGSGDRKPSSGTCAVWGRGHYRTFDGTLFSFRSRCRHLLAHECRGDTFSVHVRDSNCTDQGPGVCERSLDVYVEGLQFGFELDPPRVRLGNISSPLPTTIEGLRVDYVAGRVVISSQLGFTVTWNGEDLVEVSVDASLKGSMCGLCGQYDGNPTNDFVNNHGRHVTSRSAFLESWKKNDLEEECEDIFFDPSKQHPSEELTMEARRLCSRVTDDRFAGCHKVVDPKPYGDMCLEDYVSCLGDSAEKCRCSALAEYFRECERLGGKLDSVWRRHDFCPAGCPAGMVYSQCGASCTRTCRDPDSSCETRPCVDGCHCPAKTLLHNGRCVRREQCPCSLHAKEYRPGSLVRQECNTCECRAGEWLCSTNECPSRCVANGDPFYSTFDGKTFEFSGRCPYYLVRSQNFSVIQETGHCHNVAIDSGKGSGKTALDCCKTITVNIGDDSVVVAHGKVFVNEKQVSLPYSSDVVVVYKPSSEITQASFSNGVVLQWNRKWRLHIDSPASLSGQLRGLCGTNNRNQKDDFLTPAGDVEGSVRAFADKWKVDASCDEEELLEEHPCEQSPQRAPRAKTLCKEIHGDAFKECHQLVDPEPYYKACLHRTCACSGPVKGCVCPSLADYAAECTRKGRLTEWRRHLPLCAVSCPSDMRWTECARHKSCFGVALGDRANSSCVEGCVCADGYNKDSLCLPIDYCPCLHEHKKYLPGTVRKMGGQTCECENGEWDCSEDEEHQAVPDSPAPSITGEESESAQCAHDENSEYVSCVDACPLTCDNVNSETSCPPNYACRPGCRCKLGFVLQPSTNSCVPQSECSCKHGGKVFPAGSEIQRDCNKCTCYGGLWECDRKNCPGVCTAWGESHFNSFDGHIFDFRSDCELMLAKGRLADGSHFEVTVQNVPCAAGDNVCKRTVRIAARGQEVITLGATKNLPAVRFGPGYLLRETTLHVTVYTEIGLVVQWDKGTTVSLVVQPAWRGRVKGLCGNFDGDQNNDFQTPAGGVAEGDARVFGDAWKLQESCRSNLTSISGDSHEVCEHKPHRTAWATQRCEVLKSTLFEPCHTEVDVEPYYERCVQDVCGCDSGGDCECLCTNIAAYAHECSAQGIHIKWRSQSLCPIQCDAECSEYDACIPGCPPRTCETLGAEFGDEKEPCDNSTATCIEGCRPKPCPAGFVYDNERDMNCVPESQCRSPCQEINGRVYYEGERIEDATVAEPCESCFCRRGSIVCTGHPCPNTEPPLVARCRASGWTPWLNPAARASGDFALLADSRFASMYGAYCSLAQITDIQCRVAATGQDLLASGQMASCKLPRGFACYNRYQAGGACLDYEVRLFCNCDLVATTVVPTTTTELDCEECVSNEVDSTTATIDRSRIGGTPSPTPPSSVTDSGGFTRDVSSGTSTREQTTAEVSTPSLNKDISTTEGATTDGFTTYVRHSTPPTEEVTNQGSTRDVSSGTSSREQTTAEVSTPSRNNDISPTEETTTHGFTTYVRHSTPTTGEVTDRGSTRDVSSGTSSREQTTAEVSTPSRNNDISTTEETTTEGFTTYVRHSTPPTEEVTNRGSTRDVHGGTDTTTEELSTQGLTDYVRDRTATPEKATRHYNPTEATAPAPCVSEWTEYYNIDSPDVDDGDVEELKDLKELFPICEGMRIEDVDCRADIGGNMTDYRNTGDVGVKCSKGTGLVCLNWLQPSGKKCHDYAVRFFCKCDVEHSTTTHSSGDTGYETTTHVYEPTEVSGTATLVTESKPSAETTSFTTVGTLPPGIGGIPPDTISTCFAGWSPYVDTDQPSTDGGDFEFIDLLEKRACRASDVKAIECKAVHNVTGELIEWSQSGDNGVECLKDKGLLCFNRDQGEGRTCSNYKIRVFCVCPPRGGRTDFTVSPTVATPLVRTEPPPPKDEGSTQCGWTEWMDADDPDASDSDMGDLEIIEDLLQHRNGSCTPADVEKIECRVKSTALDWKRSGQTSLSCDANVGFRCYNNFQLKKCEDYEVRLFCACPKPGEHEERKTTTALHSTPVPGGPDVVETEPYGSSTPSVQQTTEIQETTTKSSFFSTWTGSGKRTDTTTEPPATDVSESASTSAEAGTTAVSSVDVTSSPYGGSTLRTTGEHQVQSTSPTTGQPTALCSPGRTYSDCAYRCNQTCNVFLRALVADGKCLGNDACVPGCRPTSDCEAPFVWLDYDTCIDPEECSCSFEGQILGANQVVDRGCERCICQDNQIFCAIQQDCKPLPTGLPQIVTPSSGIPVVVENATVGGGFCVPGWSMWFNTHKPDEHGDVESVSGIEQSGLPLCDEHYRTEVQCEPFARDLPQAPPQGIECDIQRGLVCKNDPANSDAPCPDYMVRFYCDCYNNWQTTPVPPAPTATTARRTPPSERTTTSAVVTTDIGTTGTTTTTALPNEVTTQTGIIYDHTSVPTSDDKCTQFVYLVNGPSPLPDSSYKASSSASLSTSPSNSRLGSTTTSTSLGAWIPRRQGLGEFVEVDLGRQRNVFGIATQGRERTHQWVERYRVLVSVDGTQYAYVQDSSGRIEDFRGNHESSGVSRQLFDRPVRARFVRIEPTAWNELIALRFDVLGCSGENLDIAPPGTTPVAPTTNAPVTGTATVVPMCPELPSSLQAFCPMCAEGMLCDGANCVAPSHCSCFQDGQLFQVNTVIRKSNCDLCSCTLYGHSKCTKSRCSCPKGQRSFFDNKCQCKCAHCPFGQRLCPTSNECIDEYKWCNGVQDCPDDEQDCSAEAERPPAMSPCLEPKKIDCPSGYEAKLARDVRCPEYKCVPINGDEDVCRLLSNAAFCTIEGRSVKTFDDVRFSHDVCDHIIFQDKVAKQFSVTAHRRCSRRGDNGGVCEAWVSVMCNRTFVKLGPTLSDVSVNGAPVAVRNLAAVSRRLGNVHLARNGQRLVFTSVKHNFEVAFDERRAIRVSVSDCLSSKTTGLCGVYDLETASEFLAPDGSVLGGAQEFAKSWATSAEAAASCALPACPRDVRERAERWCQRIATPPLSRCIADKKLTETLISTCADLVCDCLASGDADGKKCMCSAIEGMVSSCKPTVRSEIASEWRLSTGCAAMCPNGMEWRECGPSSECERTCENVHQRSGKGAEDCPDECVAGCFCPLGLVRRGNACVPPAMCHDCVCRGHGDPNYISFDGRTFEFQGNCSYMLAQHISGDKSLDFQVVGNNVECPEEPRTTCTQGLAISYGNSHVRISRGQRVQYNGNELRDKDFPWSNQEFNITWVPGRTTVVYVPAINLVVRYFELNYGFSIEVPSFTYSGKMTGLCGDCDLDSGNDLQHRSGHQSASVRDFAYSWLVDGSPEICSVLRSSSQRQVPPEVCRFQENACELYVEPEPYQHACLSDAGFSRNLSASVCRSKLQYAEHCCSTSGVSVHRWLQDSGCDFSCPKNMELRCDSGCPKTCANYRETDTACPVMPTYSCFCKKGFVLKDGECVETKYCEVCDDHGHLVGDSWQVNDCTTCTCSENLKIGCTSILCPAPPVCRDDEKLQQLPKQNGTCCETYLCDANLISSCKPPEPIVCPPGAIIKMKVDDEGCPKHVCECDPKVCPALQWPVSLDPGVEAYVEQDGCCNKVSLRCNVNQCPEIPKCPPETELEMGPGDCCTIYKCVPKNKCAYIHRYKVVNGMQISLPPGQRYQKMYPVDSSWTDGLCTNCTCSQNFHQYQYSCRVEVCPSRQKDSQDYEYSVSPRNYGVCCPEQRRTACRGNGQTYYIGSEWRQSEDGKCRSYRCEQVPGTGEAVKVVVTQICNKTDTHCIVPERPFSDLSSILATCINRHKLSVLHNSGHLICLLQSEKYVEPTPGSGDCCGHCVREFCEESGNLYQVGERWRSTIRPCFDVQCERNEQGVVVTKYTLQKCPELPSNCPKNNIVRDETGCCQRCQVTPGSCAPHAIDKQKTVEYFTLYDVEHGRCSNTDYISDLTECRGQCFSKTVFNSATNNFTSNCRCCTIKTSVQRKVTLTCEGGHRVMKDYLNPTECSCTTCGDVQAGSPDMAVPIPL